MSVLEEIKSIQADIEKLEKEVADSEADIETRMAAVEQKKIEIKALKSSIDLASRALTEEKASERDSFFNLRLALEGAGYSGTALDQYMRDRGLEPKEAEEEAEEV